MIGAIILGLVAGFIGKALVPGEDPGGFFVTIGIGLVGAVVGWLIFTAGLGIGDTDMFDLGGLLSAIIGVVIVLLGYRVATGRRVSRG
ncbi:GlsB/YeaQ/YmgE family stress response membrane protein [Patulibacter brassicae]|uniref:GlsB/YeaQ/YmgE family stress response membrane protein n=1 Tax=Patulibacter brassicae TaxID=1705717 RepID=A0ABU4VI05_9ACTN|nr:GlsB/YeaQ/YmgE family stress response membrane protein [Patulibacter brassicae]MDX8151461.1 GlsB/YeaQ/YmgE family stress response membrane protein [Patulibacter brassicae]